MLLKRSEAIQQKKRPQSKKDVMKTFRTSSSYTEYFPNMHVILAHLFNLLHGEFSIHWSQEHENCFRSKTNFNDVFTVSIGTVLVQADDGQMRVISTSFIASIIKQKKLLHMVN